MKTPRVYVPGADVESMIAAAEVDLTMREAADDDMPEVDIDGPFCLHWFD
jgi:hypothetical protein